MDKKQIKAAFKQDAALLKMQAKGRVKMDCEKIIAGRLEEAKSALKAGYNEQAEFDAALISVVLDLCGKQPKKAVISTTGVAGNVPYADLAYAKLKSADLYWAYYEQEGDDMLRQIAKQSLAHAAALLTKVDDKDAANDLKSKLYNAEKTIQ